MIQFSKVDKIYHNGTVAIKDINLKIKDKEFISIVGPSGAGKSTLIRLLIAEESPTNGHIAVGGVDVTRLPFRKIPYYRRKLGVVFQDFKLLPKITVFENVAFAMEVSGDSGRLIKRVITIIKTAAKESHPFRQKFLSPILNILLIPANDIIK